MAVIAASVGPTGEFLEPVGEMTAEQLWETTLNPETRRLLQVDYGAVDTDATQLRFTMLMGKGEAAARRVWLEEHGNDVDVDV